MIMMTKEVRPILISTSKKSHIYSSQHRLHYEKYPDKKVIAGNKSLYLVSLEDDNIEVGDKFYYKHFNTYIVDTANERTDMANINKPDGYFKKVIATQEQLPKEYIQQFINEYNLNTVKDIEIEMEEYWVNLLGIGEEKRIKPKLDSNGHVIIIGSINKTTITFPEITLDSGSHILYSEEEVKALLSKAFDDFIQDDDDTIGFNLNDWWNNNKKK